MTIVNLEKYTINASDRKTLPEESGIYIFWERNNKPLYVGKSRNLKHRLASYFTSGLSPKTAKMMSEAKYFSIIKVTSEIESLLLEASLVKKLKPFYNSQLRDDKHPLYIKISKEKYPRVATVRKKDTIGETYFGPFPSSGNVKSVLKMLRRIFPFAQHKPGKRACLYKQMGLCNPCPSEIESSADENFKKSARIQYLQNIKIVKMILGGKIKMVRSKLEKKMYAYAKEEDFEKAKTTKEKIEKLDYITQPIIPSKYYLTNPNLAEDLRKEELYTLKKILDRFMKIDGLERIECFDASHIGGISATASMVTFINGDPEKNLYRHFRIKGDNKKSDTDSLREVVRRRINNFKRWGRPDLVIVDGGKPQVSVFFQELREHKIPVVGIAKRFETLVIPIMTGNKTSYVQIRLKNSLALMLVQRLRNEAHRFARRYHHKLMQKRLYTSGVY